MGETETAVESFSVMWGADAELIEQCRAIRLEVFVQEQKFTAAQVIDECALFAPLSIMYDAQDSPKRSEERYVHFLALDQAGIPAATVRFIPGTGQIGRVAVVKRYRGMGLGRLLLEACLGYVRGSDAGLEQVYLHSVDVEMTKRFYERAGFEIDGPVFEEAGVGHVNMVFKLKK